MLPPPPPCDGAMPFCLTFPAVCDRKCDVVVGLVQQRSTAVTTTTTTPSIITTIIIHIVRCIQHIIIPQAIMPAAAVLPLPLAAAIAAEQRLATAAAVDHGPW